MKEVYFKARRISIALHCRQAKSVDIENMRDEMRKLVV